MKTCSSLFSSAGLFGACSTLSLFAAPGNAPRPDSAANLLARQGSITIAAAGPYVEAGTFRTQVEAKLGAPDLVLRDETWLYHHRRIDGSAATGTLVVRFTNHRVTSLTLVTPAVVVSMQAELMKPNAPSRLATK